MSAKKKKTVGKLFQSCKLEMMVAKSGVIAMKMENYI